MRWHTDTFRIDRATDHNSVLSENNRALLRLQDDGNLVLYDTGNGKALWASDTNGKGSSHAVFQHDGNLVLYAGTKALWASDTYGHVGAELALQDDGNLVVYDYQNKPLWATDTYGFESHGGFGGWIENAVKSAGKAVGTVVHAVADVSSSVADRVKNIPVVGPLFHSAYNLYIGNQLALADGIASGKRLDKAAMGYLQDQVNSYKEEAPYIQTVVSVVPGIGPGISGAIGAGVALAEGKTIDEALLAGVRGALPGGPLAAAAFDVGLAAAQGKPIEQIALAALPIDDDAKHVLSVALDVTRKLANGEPVTDVALNAVIAELPPEEQKLAQTAVNAAKGQNVADAVANIALNYAIKAVPDSVKTTITRSVQTGIALGTGSVLQNSIVNSVGATVDSLAQKGAEVLGSNPLAKAASIIAGQAGSHGFQVGLGLMQHKVTSFELQAVRDKLDALSKKGFDMAVSMHVGQVTQPATGLKPAPMPNLTKTSGLKPAPMPKITAAQSNAHAAAHLMVHGMRGQSPAQAASMLQTIANASPEAAKGAGVALKQIPTPPAHLGWFHRLLMFLHLEKRG